MVIGEPEDKPEKQRAVWNLFQLVIRRVNEKENSDKSVSYKDYSVQTTMLKYAESSVSATGLVKQTYRLLTPHWVYGSISPRMCGLYSCFSSS